VTAAEDRRDEVEAALWKVPGITAADVDRVLAAVEAYATVRARRAAQSTAAEGRTGPGPKAESKPPAVHYAPAGDRAACIPYDLSGLAAFGRTLATDPASVTCGHCRKTAAWREASAARGPGVVHFAGGGGRWSCRPWDMVMSGTVTLACGDVTCGNCRRTPAWRQADAEGGRPEWAVALDELLGSDP
jgi:copper chaperone CopZ